MFHTSISFIFLENYGGVLKLGTNDIKKNIKDILINSTTSKWLGKLLFGIFIAVIGGLILLIIWALFETELTEYFRTLKN